MAEIQIIKTGAEDMVVLSRRDYDALLARAGDPAGEDAMTARILAAEAHKTALPGEVLDRILDGESPILVMMQYRGLTQADLAARSGLSQPFISKLVRGEVGGRSETISAIALALDVSVDILAG